jgi:hypothetical protein
MMMSIEVVAVMGPGCRKGLGHVERLPARSRSQFRSRFTRPATATETVTRPAAHDRDRDLASRIRPRPMTNPAAHDRDRAAVVWCLPPSPRLHGDMATADKSVVNSADDPAWNGSAKGTQISQITTDFADYGPDRLRCTQEGCCHNSPFKNNPCNPSRAVNTRIREIRVNGGDSVRVTTKQ